MADVPKHHSEEKGESHCREDGRVDLLVARNTIGVSDLLGDQGIAVGVEGCWRLRQAELLNFWGGSDHLYPLDEVELLADGEVDVSYYEVLPQKHLVETVIDEFLLPEVSPPGLEGVPVGDRVKILSELPLVQLEKVVDFVVFAHARLHARGILLAFVELDQQSGKGLQDPRHLLL